MPAYAAYTGWHADTMFSFAPSKARLLCRHAFTLLTSIIHYGSGARHATRNGAQCQCVVALPPDLDFSDLVKRSNQRMCRSKDECLSLKGLRLVQSYRHTIIMEGAAYVVMIRSSMHTSPPRPSASVHTPNLWALRFAHAVQVGKHTTALGGTAYIMTSGPSLAVHQTPAARLFAWAITNTSMLAQPVRTHRATCVQELPAMLLSSSFRIAERGFAQSIRISQGLRYPRCLWVCSYIWLHCTDKDFTLFRPSPSSSRPSLTRSDLSTPSALCKSLLFLQL